jgi:hypothetical protein
LRGAGSQAVRRWLTQTCPQTDPGLALVRYWLGMHRPAYIWGARIARAALPLGGYRWTARRLGAIARQRGSST